MEEDFFEEDGLRIYVNEQDLTITLDWDPETHPKWNELQNIPEEDLIKRIVAMAEEGLKKESAEENEAV